MSYTRVTGPDGSPRTDVVSRDSDGIYVATSPDCPFWMVGDALAYQAWLAAGNAPSTPASSTALPTVTGNQWTFALKDLGLGSTWRAARARSKSDDQSRVELIARDTPLQATDPLLIRVAANAGTNADGSSVIDVPTVFARAQSMPL